MGGLPCLVASMRPDSVVNELVRPVPIYPLKLYLQRFGRSGLHCQGFLYKPVTRQHVGKDPQADIILPLHWDKGRITVLVSVDLGELAFVGKKNNRKGNLGIRQRGGGCLDT